MKPARNEEAMKDDSPIKKAHLRIRFLDGTVVEKEVESDDELRFEVTKLHLLFQEFQKMRELEGDIE
jgi:hypothetical protein